MPTRPVLPSRVCTWLRTRHNEPKSVCIVEPDHELAIKWLRSLADLVDEQKADSYSWCLHDVSLTIQWEYCGPKQVVRVFTSYESACEVAFDDVAVACHFPEGVTNV